MWLGKSWLGARLRQWLFRAHSPIQTRKKIGKRRSVMLMFELLEERLAPAVVNYTASSHELDFTADAAQTVTVTAPSPNSVVIEVSGGNTISLTGDALSNSNFSPSNGNDTLTIDTAAGKAPVSTFNLYLSNTALSADTLAFGLADGTGISNANISGPAGPPATVDTVDTVTLNSVTLGSGSLSASAGTINLAGAVTTTANVSLTAADTATLSNVSIGGSLSVSAGTINDTFASGTVTGDVSLTAANTVTLKSLTVGSSPTVSSLTVTAGSVGTAGTINVNGELMATGDLSLTADAPVATPTGMINLNAEIEAKGNISLSATGTIDIDAEIDATGNVSLTSVNPLVNGVFQGQVSFTPSGSGDTITGPAGFDWSSYGFQSGQTITVSGSAIAANDGTYTIAASGVSGNVLTLTSDNAVTLDTNDPDVNITVDNDQIVGATATLDVTGSGTAVPVSIAVQSVDAQKLDATTNNGNMLIENSSPLALGQLNAGDAAIVLDVAGAITDGEAAGVVNLTAGNGAVLTTTGNNSAIGTSTDPIVTAIGELTATANDGGVYILDSNGPGLLVNSVVAKYKGLTPQVNPNDTSQIVVNTATGNNAPVYVPEPYNVSITAAGPIVLNSVTAPNDVNITSTGAFILTDSGGSQTLLAQNVSLVADGTADYVGTVTYTPSASGDMLTNAAGWTGFVANEEIVIAGASKPNNNGAFTIKSVSGDTLTLTATNTLVAGTDDSVTVGDGMIGLAGAALPLSDAENVSASTQNGDINLAPTSTTTLTSINADTGTDNNVSVKSTAPSLTVGTITATGNVTLQNSDGSLVESGNGSITGQNVSLSSEDSIGSFATDASVGLSATVTSAGDTINVANTGALSSVTASVEAGNVTIHYTGGSLLFAENTSELTATGTAVVSFTNTGNVILANAMTASSITSTNGAISDPGAFEISGSTVTLTAGNGIGVSGAPIMTQVTTALDATTTSQGIYMQQAGAFTLNAATTDTTAGNIDVTDTTGNMTLGVVSAPVAVTLDAESGAILNGLSGTSINVFADTLTLTATNGIGTSSAPLAALANTLTADGGASGGLWLINNSALMVTSATAEGGPISISASGALTLNGNVSAGTAADVTLIANGALTGSGTITASTATLTASQIGQGAGELQLDVTTLDATATEGGIYVTNSNTGTLTLTASASGPMNNVDIASAGNISLISITAPGGTVTLASGSADTITNGNPSPSAINITANTLDITATGGIGTMINPLLVDVNNEDTVDGGTPGAFLTDVGPTLITAAALEAAGSGTLTFEAGSITIANFGGTTVNVASGRSLVLESTTGPIVFLNPADTIETSGGGTITVDAGTTAGSTAVAVLGNLKTDGGNITVSAPGNISIGQLDAVKGSTKGNVSVLSAAGIILSSNGASPAVIAGSATLSGSAPTAAALQLSEIQAIAAAAAAAAQVNAEQTSSTGLNNALASINASLATDSVNLATAKLATNNANDVVGNEQTVVTDLTDTATALSVAAGVLTIVATFAGVASAISTVAAEFGATVAPATVTAFATQSVAVLTLASAAVTIAITVATNDLLSDQATASADQSTQDQDQAQLNADTDTQTALTAALNIGQQAVTNDTITSEADQVISQQAIAAYAQLNVIGSATAPLDVDVSGPINVTAGPTDSYLQVTGSAAVDQINATGGVELISTGAITHGSGAGTDITTPELTLVAANGIGTSLLNPLVTATPTLTATNTSSGGIYIFNTAPTSAGLNLAGVSNMGSGNVDITEGSPLTVSANMISVGAVSLTAGPGSSPLDNLTVDSGVTVQSTASSVSLDAGNNVIVQPGSTIEADTGISITGGADGVAANVEVLGTLIAGTSASIGVDAADTTNANTFTINPSVATSISIDGGTLLGTNTLYFNADGLAVTIQGNQITAAGCKPVTFTEFATVYILNSKGGGSITLDESAASANTFVLTGTGREAGNWTLSTLNGGATTIAFTGVTTFTYDGGNLGDTMTVSPYGTAAQPWNVSVAINGGTDTAGNYLTYNSVPGLADSISVTQTGNAAGQIASPDVEPPLQSDTPVVTFTSVVNITLTAGSSEYTTLGLEGNLGSSTPGYNTLNVQQGANTVGGAQTLGYTLNSLATLNFNLENIEAVDVAALPGTDLIQVGVADTLQTTNPAASLSFNVNGGSNSQNDQLLVQDLGGNLDIIRRGAAQYSGSVTIGAFNPVIYQNITTVDVTPINPITGGTGPVDPNTGERDGRLVVFQYDPFAFNNTLPNAALLSSVTQALNGESIALGGIDSPPFEVGGEEEWYQFDPTHTSTYQIEILFNQIGTLANGRPGLPGNGNLSLGIYDADGNLITSGSAVTGGVSATFAATPSDPQYASIFVCVQGATAAAINTYQFANSANGGVTDVGTEVNSRSSGPVITGVSITSSPNYNLFSQQLLGANAPTPLVNSITIGVTDPLPRAPGYLYPALNPTVAENPAEYIVQGSAVGIVDITSVDVINNTPVEGSPATATITLNFASPLPDDHYTFTILDSLINPVGVELDGISNATEPNSSGIPTFPSGNGQPGSNFVANFTVDSRAKIAAWSNSTVDLDLSDDIVSNPSIGATLNFGSSTDTLFAGQFLGTDDNGYDKLAAYGEVNGSYRFLINVNGNGTGIESITSNVQIDGLPVAGNFSDTPNDAAGDGIGLFSGTTWYLATNPNNPYSMNETLPSDMRGYPIVGDFLGNGLTDLATYQPADDLLEFDLAGPNGQLTGQYNATLSLSGQAAALGLAGVMVRPAAGDLTGNGVTDIGLFVPSAQSTGTAQWYFFVPNPTMIGSVSAFNHTFQSVQDGGNDLYFQFGSNSDQPLVGNFDPPSGSPNVLNPTNTTVALGSGASPAFENVAQTLSVTANVTDAAGTVSGGTVTFTLFNSSNQKIGSSVTTGNVVLGAASAVLTIPVGEPAGAYSVHATYNGASNLETSTGSASFSISTGSTTVTMAAVTKPFALANQSVVLTAKVTSPGNTVSRGTVTFTLLNGSNTVIGTPKSGTVASGATSVTFILPGGTPAGAYTITLSYSGSGNFASTTSTAPLTITPLATTTTAQAATATFNSGNQVVTLKASVTSTVAVNGGTVTFTVYNAQNNVIGSAVTSAAVASGQASAAFTLPANTPAGSYKVIASYNGSTNFSASSDATKLLTVAKAATVTSVSTVTTAYSTTADTITLQAAVTSTAGVVGAGTITFTIENSSNKVIGSAVSGVVSNGEASVSYVLPAKTAAGTYRILVSYAGDPNFLASSGNAQLTIS